MASNFSPFPYKESCYIRIFSVFKAEKSSDLESGNGTVTATEMATHLNCHQNQLEIAQVEGVCINQRHKDVSMCHFFSKAHFVHTLNPMTESGEFTEVILISPIIVSPMTVSSGNDISGGPEIYAQICIIIY